MYACMHTLLKVSFLPRPQNNLLLFAAEESKKRGIVKHNWIKYEYFSREAA